MTNRELLLQLKATLDEMQYRIRGGVSLEPREKKNQRWEVYLVVEDEEVLRIEVNTGKAYVMSRHTDTETFNFNALEEKG